MTDAFQEENISEEVTSDTFSLLSSIFTYKHSNLGPDILTDSRFDPLFTPFDISWAFGFDVSVPVINITTSDRRDIFYTAGNVGILYDYCKKQMVHFRGHKNKIVCASADASGRWLVTADNGKDNAIIIWDTYTRNIVWTIFEHPGSDGDLRVALSPNAKLLITVSTGEETNIYFWLWTYGNEKPDDIYRDERDLGAAKAIKFHPNKEDHLMVVFEKAVLFFCWDHEQKKVSKPTSPKVAAKCGACTDATYVDSCHECFVSTSRGNVLVFGNTIYTKPFSKEEALDNDKMYVKSIRTSKGHVTCITSVDDVVVTGDSNGAIMFFDRRLKLLFWFAKRVTKPVCGLSFRLWPRKCKAEALTKLDDVDEEWRNIPDCQDVADEHEVLMKRAPSDATLARRPFFTRDFFISTHDGNIILVNVANKRFVPLFPPADSNVAAIDVHDERPYIIIAFAKGRLTIYNYETHEEVVSTVLPVAEGDAVTTVVKYSPRCLHLACGRSNGEVWLLQPALLTQIYVEPFRFSNRKVEKIVFSKNSLQMAYYDDNMTVFGFYYETDSEDWVFKGKVRSHYKEICHMLFLDEDPYGLYTIGKDRHIIKYTDLVAEEEELDIFTRDRIEQQDIPLYFIPYPKKKLSKSGYFLIVDDKHKYKLISAKTNMCTAVYLGPAYGCFQNNPVRKIEFIPKHDKKFLVFMTKNQIGIQMMPIDGNPYNFVGALAHPEEVTDFRLSPNGQYVFTMGKNDRTVLMWKIKVSSVEKLHQVGGVELQPYFCLLEGGRGGFLYKEMKDLFYYMQILQQGEKVVIPRVVSNQINIVELPDLMRACGYYPSEYEIENLLTDIRYKDFDDTGVLKDKATFCEFVKLFINHKPAYGYSLERLERCFETITTFTDMYGTTEMPRDDFIEAITTTGEQVSTEQIYRCLRTLLHEDVGEDVMGERDFGFMNDEVDFYYLAEEILGLNMESIEEERRPEEDGNNDDTYY